MESVTVAPFTARFDAAFAEGDRQAAAKHYEQGRVDVVRQLFETLGRGDMEAFLSHLHPDVELEIAAPAEFPWRRTARGLDDLRAAVEYNFGVVQDQDPRLVSITAQGDVVVVVGRECGRIRQSGAHYHVYFTYQFTFRDDQVHRILEIAAATQDACADYA